VLVNNAASSMASDNVDNLVRVISRRYSDVNYFGTWHCRAGVPLIAKSGGGAEINQSSSAAWLQRSTRSSDGTNAVVPNTRDEGGHQRLTHFMAGSSVKYQIR